ncbi:MAG TPA: oxygen-dependent coproporphyrinogen oxidase [Candidatus Bathyarchaeia archaeon]|jgi:coproporphyrinogen III oxidase|nr:oxygen-dependent coproporphyrinogen oxidase [Candidatus Bathyarchaeia archaeon]
MVNVDLNELGCAAARYFEGLQEHICTVLEELETRSGSRARFCVDRWESTSDGGGITCVLSDGAVFEKAGVNFSDVKGSFSEELAASMPGTGPSFAATGISIVIHPRNPFVPTVHANFRHISKGSGQGRAAWFGGGSDLTPYYPRREDIIHFHRTWKEVCERHTVADYWRFKKWCDEYFYLPHRNEARGVGGIFFDYLTERYAEVFAFVRDAGDHFLGSYVPIVERRFDEPYGDKQRRWQLLRRGRYVEFNLLYDRGTMFGLKTVGRVESILMSMPPQVVWGYNDVPLPGSPEAELFAYLKPRDWASDNA